MVHSGGRLGIFRNGSLSNLVGIFRSGSISCSVVDSLAWLALCMGCGSVVWARSTSLLWITCTGSLTLPVRDHYHWLDQFFSLVSRSLSRSDIVSGIVGLGSLRGFVVDLRYRLTQRVLPRLDWAARSCPHVPYVLRRTV